MRQINVLILVLCASVAWATEGALNGKFTVNEQGKQVQFAPGNLQYVPSMGVWQFATSQTEVIGKDAAYVTANPGYGGAIDLFPWAGTYGDSIDGGWRMLTDEEWQYLLREEEIGSGPMNTGQATIGTQHGLMLVPDDWQKFATLTFSPSPDNWTTNSYTAANWEQLETSGAVFLPCVGEMGSYWSATPKGESNAYGMYFSASAIEAGYSSARSNNYAVRLVKDVKETPTDVEEIKNYELKISNKILRDGQIVIVRDGKTYSILGQEK